MVQKFENGCQPTMVLSPLTGSLETESQRLVYLITYSRIDATTFPTRESFLKAVLEGWKNRGIWVLQWVVSLEGHTHSDVSSSDISNHYYYHMAIKLSKRARWLQVRNILDEKYHIQVNFSNNHNTYYSAYRYVTKDRPDTILIAMDVSSLFANIPQEEGIEIVCKAYEMFRNNETLIPHTIKGKCLV